MSTAKPGSFGCFFINIAGFVSEKTRRFEWLFQKKSIIEKIQLTKSEKICYNTSYGKRLFLCKTVRGDCLYGNCNYC